MSDPYSVLGVSPDASDDDIKKAYRKLSRRFHPDANVNNPNKEQAEEKFKQIQEAYDIIMKMREQGYRDYNSYSSYGSGGAYGNGSGSYGGAYGGSGYGGQGSYQGQQTGYGYGSGSYGSSGYQDGFGQGGNPFGRGWYWSPFGGFYSWGTGNNGQSQGSHKWDRYSGETGQYLKAAANYIYNRSYREALNVLDGMADRPALWYYYAAIANNGCGNNINALEYAKRAAEMEPGDPDYQSLVSQLQNGGRWYASRGADYGRMSRSSSSLACALFAGMLCCPYRWYFCCL
jgi:molecular chaperone DnaJ